MRRRMRPVLAAAVWATLGAWPAAQAGIPKATELNPGTVTPGGGKYIVIGCVTAFQKYLTDGIGGWVGLHHASRSL